MDAIDEQFPNLLPADRDRIREAVKQSGGGFQVLQGGAKKSTVVSGGHPRHNSNVEPWPEHVPSPSSTD